MREYDLLIEGKLVGAHGGATIATRNAFDGELVSVVPKSAARDARRAIDAARRSADAGVWSDVSIAERRAALLRVASLLWERQAEIADVDTAEAGVPIRVSSTLVGAAIDAFRDAADVSTPPSSPEAKPGVPAFVAPMREAFGVVSLIAAADAPFVRAMTHLGATLVHGNAVVLCPPSSAPSSALEIARAFSESDVPPGAVNVISGGDRGVHEELASNALIDAVVTAGPVEDVQRIAEAAARGRRHAAIPAQGAAVQVVLDDADLDLAVPGALWSAFFLSGRTGRAASKLLVHASIAEPVVHHLVRGARALRPGNPSSFDTDIGPVGGPAAAARLEAAVMRAIEDGAARACGGLLSGSLVAPVVLTGVTGYNRVVHEELRGPILSVIAFTDLDEAVALSGMQRRPAAVLWTRDAYRAWALARRLRADEVWINDYEHVPVPGRDDATRVKRVAWDERRSARARAWMPLLGLDRIYGFGSP